LLATHCVLALQTQWVGILLKEKKKKDSALDLHLLLGCAAASVVPEVVIPRSVHFPPFVEKGKIDLVRTHQITWVLLHKPH